MNASPPKVTICVPAYRSAGFVNRALASAKRQTYDRIRVIVSVDRSGDATEAVCRDFEGDPRFEVHAQPERLGWAGNVNFLLDRVRTPFYLILFHDDELDERYVELLLAAEARDPDALCYYPDIAHHGIHDGTHRYPSLDGPPRQRLMSMLTGPTTGIATRGLTRSWPVANGLRLRLNPFDSFLSDMLFMFELAALGRLLRVPMPIYRKWARGNEESVTNGWRREPSGHKLAAWVAHTIGCAQVVLGAQGLAADDRQALVAACLLRLVVHANRVRGVDGQGPVHSVSNLLLSSLVVNGIAGAEPAGDGALADLAEDGSIRVSRLW